MAKNKCTVYLGYEDESITDKNKCGIDYKTNKIGGIPDWPFCGISIPQCPICGLERTFIMQIYAPMEGSSFHRTLFIFTCLSPYCSNNSQSWLCVRSQILEKNTTEKEITKKSQTANIVWCSEMDDWDDSENCIEQGNEINCNEENGNIIKADNRFSDDEDESNSLDNDNINGFGNLHIDDRNANLGAQGGAIGNINTFKPSAEIDGDESDSITIDSPIMPQRDLLALLKKVPTIKSDLRTLKLNSFFIYVEEENRPDTSISAHIRDLIQEYQKIDDDVRKLDIDLPISSGKMTMSGHEEVEIEQYERGVPAHGDKMFHNFLLTIQENPSQILRYSRDTFPLLASHMTEPVARCQNCGGNVICELQIMPTIIPKLTLTSGERVPIEFGTVLIFTCVKSCWDTPDKMRLENVIVQKEIFD